VRESPVFSRFPLSPVVWLTGGCVFDSSALFHTKPSSHDKKLVKEGFSRALFVPLHAKFWRQKVRPRCMRPLRIPARLTWIYPFLPRLIQLAALVL
jgi:hypothetical protein